MCGISGFCNFKRDLLASEEESLTRLRTMSKRQAHRGNDHFGSYLCRHAGFSHARLSIRDIEKGNQPILRRHNKKSYCIVYNGELYNMEEFIPDLTAAGFRFQTNSDTEVILYCFIHYGPSFVQKLNGIFAFAIWDDYEQKLYLYRDRVGVKPLFYCQDNEEYLFASEPKAIFAGAKSFQPAIGENELLELLAIGPARTSGTGIFAGMHEVLPGHYLCLSKHGIDDITYWDLSFHRHTDSYADTVETVSYLVRDSVKRQMVSDVPVCTFLSGGVDSSIVTALAYSFLKEKGETLNTFSFDFKGNDQYFKPNSFQSSQDLPYVNLMLQKYPTNHTYLTCDEDQLMQSLFTAVDAKDSPGMTDVDASLLYFCSLVKEHNKVALTGECADEIFGGYPWFYRKELMDQDGFPWSADTSARTLLLKDSVCDKLQLQTYAHERYLESLNHAPVPSDDFFLSSGYVSSAGPSSSADISAEKRRLQISYLNIKWFMQTLLDRMDRTSMYYGLEARVPFADHRIIEYVFSVPWEMKYHGGHEKGLLRDATKDLLPPEISNRKKSPYPKTYHPRYEKLLADRLLLLLEDSTSPILPLLDKEKVKQFALAPKEYGKPWYGQLMAGPQLMAYYLQLDAWMRLYHLELPI